MLPATAPTFENLIHPRLVPVPAAAGAFLVFGRAATVDFRAIDADARRDRQSHPVEANGMLDVTTLTVQR